jgi:hypothetical protein
MRDDIIEVFDDIDNLDLPDDLDKLDKIHCRLMSGKRIYWYYDEDLRFYNDQELNIRDCYQSIYSGIVIPMPDVENRGSGELEYGDAIIIMDYYPAEKEYPQTTWIALNRLVDNSDLIEIFSRDN